jgi:Rad3-related DNA helicase
VDYQYQTTVHKFLMNYLRGGEGQSQVKRAIGGGSISEAVEVKGEAIERR